MHQDTHGNARTPLLQQVHKDFALNMNYFQQGCAVQIRVLHLLHPSRHKYYLNNTNKKVEYLFYQFLVSSVQGLLLLNPLHVLGKETNNTGGEAAVFGTAARISLNLTYRGTE